MSYEDEKIIEIKKESRRVLYTDIKSGIYVDDQFTVFSLRKLNNGVEMYIPDDFIEMPEEIQILKYPSVSRPQAILTSLDTKVNFAVNLMGQCIQKEQIESFLIQIKEVIKKVNPAINFYQNKENCLSEEKKIHMFDFKSFGIDGALYNMVVFIFLKDKVCQGIFNCPEQEAESWKEAAWQAFQTIEA